MFPPLALLIGAALAETAGPAGAFRRLRTGFGGFAFLCGLLAAGACVAVLRAGVIRQPGQALALRPYAIAMAAILVPGGVAAWAIARRLGASGGLARASSPRPSPSIWCSSLPRRTSSGPARRRSPSQAGALARPGDRIFHYHGFFHDFTFYARRTVGTVAHADELELQFLDPAERAARFIDDAAFRRAWEGPGRILAVARKRDVAALFADPSFRYHLLGESADHYLFSNQP